MKEGVRKKIMILVLVVLLFVGLYFLWQKLPIALPFLSQKSITDYIPKDENTVPVVLPSAINETKLPLVILQGFRVSIFAKNLSGARVLQFDAQGNAWVSRTSAGVVSRLEIKNGAVVSQRDVFQGLQNPHGLAFDPDNRNILYIAEENRIRKFDISNPAHGEEVLLLPAGKGHFTRTIAFGPDKKLYITVGSSCNVCRELDEKRASMLRYDPVTRKSEIFATGLRNSVFFTWDTQDKLFATDMGRDLLGDNIPPDEINIIQEGKNYGWPICYGKNIHDTNFDTNTHIRNPCMEPNETSSFIDIPAHSAPLGLAFAPLAWPKEYQNNLFVSYHGSWNRSVPTGYKVVQMKIDANGNYLGTEDFITGWLASGSALGRPVDIIFGSDNAMYISDDKAGVIYKMELIR